MKVGNKTINIDDVGKVNQDDIDLTTRLVNLESRARKQADESSKEAARLNDQIRQFGQDPFNQMLNDVIGTKGVKGIGVRVDAMKGAQLIEAPPPPIPDPLEAATDNLQANEVGVQAWYIAEEWANNKPMHLTQSELCHGVANSILQMLDQGRGRVPPMTLVPKYNPEDNDDCFVTDYHDDRYPKYNWNYDQPIMPTEVNAFSNAHAETYDKWRDRPSISASELFD